MCSGRSIMVYYREENAYTVLSYRQQCFSENRPLVNNVPMTCLLTLKAKIALSICISNAFLLSVAQFFASVHCY